MSMENNKELYVFGLPIETGLCSVRFLKYIDYIQLLPELSAISLNVLHLYYQYRKANVDDDPKIDAILEEFKKESLFNIVQNEENLLTAYEKVFKLVIGEDDIVERILSNEELFMEYRALIMDMNMLTEEEVNPNPEIQEYIEAGREVKQLDAEKQSYSDIISSIVVGIGVEYSSIADWSVFQVYATYYRLGAFKNSDVSALFATVSDKVKYENWQKHIDLFENEKSGMKMSEFNKQYGGLFK